MQFLKHAPLPCRDIEKALRKLGFEPTGKHGTSHEHWEQIRDGHKYKVTVDCHKGEVRALDVKSIIRQAGVTKKQFLAALNS